jgi:hypothetical protein
VDGIPHGEVNLKYYRNNDREMTEETFTMVNGVIQGRRSIVTGMFRGHTYELECNYLDGKLHGMLKMQQRFVTCDGQEYHQTTTQEYHHDEPKGSRITYMQPIFGPLNHIKMLQSVVSIRNGKLNGTVAMYHPGTSKQLAFIANFRDGILKGKFRRWDERGELMESHFFTGEEHYQPDQEYDILKTWIDSQIDLTLYEVPPLKAHIMTAIDPDHSVGFSFPDPSLLSPNVMLTIMDNTFNTVKGLKHFKGYFSTSTYDDDYYYPPRYEDEDYYSDDYDDGASSEWDFSRSR